jgi:MinD-like ATPase involved in chromosome partitioning or flagellar assembly
MKVITCYSYKGGVGRTLTAANFSLYLAKLGFQVVAIDFDFEAPGLDSKFGNIRLNEKQRGMLDLILDYQLNGTVPETLAECAIPVPFDASSESTGSLRLIPAGDYLGEEYPTKLNMLDWDAVFATERAGVAFLVAFLRLVERAFAADFVVIDSRTGISETAGVCTQLLADEVLMFSSLAAESVKMTTHLARVIQNSKIAKSMGKRVDVKVVVTRVPQPPDIEGFRKRWREAFAVPEERFFVLFSSPLLESNEYLAVNAPTRSGDLTANYIELFQSLKLELAGDRIKAQIDQTTKTLLLQPERAESVIRSLVALYPSADSYRAAMRFFVVAQQPGEVRRFAWRILRAEPDDIEAHKLLGKTYIDPPITDNEERKSALKAFRWLDDHGCITPQEAIRYADLLEDDRAYQLSFEVVSRFMENDALSLDQRVGARAIAVRTALHLEKRDVAIQLALQIPRERISGRPGVLLVEHYIERGDFQNASDVGKIVLGRSPSTDLIRRLSKLVEKIPQMRELQKMLEAAAADVRLTRETEIRHFPRGFLFHEAREDAPPSGTGQT